MKKLLTLLAILVSFNAFSQNTTTLPSPTTSFVPSFRYYGVLTDSLRQTWMATSTGGWNRIFTATEANLRFAPIVGGGYVPTTRTLTIAGVTYDLSANRIWTLATHSLGYGLSGSTYNGSTGVSWAVDSTLLVTKTFAARYPLKSLLFSNGYGMLGFGDLSANRTPSVDTSLISTHIRDARFVPYDNWTKDVTAGNHNLALGTGYYSMSTLSGKPTGVTGETRMYRDSVGRWSYMNGLYRRTFAVRRSVDNTITYPWKLNPTLVDSLEASVGYIHNSTTAYNQDFNLGTGSSQWVSGSNTVAISGANAVIVDGSVERSNYGSSATIRADKTQANRYLNYKGDRIVYRYDSFNQNILFTTPTADNNLTIPNKTGSHTFAFLDDLTGGYVPLTRTVTAGVGLSGGGALSSNITLNADTAGTLASKSYLQNYTYTKAQVDNGFVGLTGNQISPGITGQKSFNGITYFQYAPSVVNTNRSGTQWINDISGQTGTGNWFSAEMNISGAGPSGTQGFLNLIDATAGTTVGRIYRTGAYSGVGGATFGAITAPASGFILDVRGRIRANSFQTGTAGTDSLVVHDGTGQGLKLISPSYYGVATNYYDKTTSDAKYVDFTTNQSIPSMKTFNPTIVGTSVATSITSSHTATANNQVLTGLLISPTFSNGGFTGVVNAPVRVTVGSANLSVSDVIGGSNITLHGSATPSLTNYFLRTDNSTLYLNAPNAAGDLVFRIGTTNAGRFVNTTYNFLVGGTTDNGYKGDFQASGTSGYLKAGSFSVNSSGVTNIANLTASQAVFTDASKNLVSNAITGTGNVVMSASPTMTNPVVGTQSFGDNSTKAASTAFVQAAIPVSHTVDIRQISTNLAASTTITVSIGVTLPSSTYSVMLTPTNVLTSTSNYYVTNKTTTQYDIVFTAIPGGIVSFDEAIFQ